MAFRVSLKNPFASKEVVAGTLEQGATKQDKTDFFSDPALYDFICIETSGNYFGQAGKRCFDKVTLYESGLSSTVFG